MEIDMSNYNYDADAFAQIAAEAKKINTRLEDAKKKIMAYGLGDHVGEFYTVTYKLSEAPLTFDKDIASELLTKFGLSAEQIDAVWKCKSEGAPRKLVSYEATAISTAEALAA
jgi:hypothetical protein